MTDVPLRSNVVLLDITTEPVVESPVVGSRNAVLGLSVLSPIWNQVPVSAVLPVVLKAMPYAL